MARILIRFPMAKCLVAFLLLIGTPIWSSQKSSAQINQVTVEPRDSMVVRVRPTETVTLVFRIKNETQREGYWTPYVTLPDDWKLVRQLRPLHLAAGGQSLRLVTVGIPERTHAGRYAVGLEMQLASGRWVKSQQKVTVSPLRHIEITLSNLPRFMKAGEQYLVEGILRNRGNVKTEGRLEAFPSQDLNALLEFNAFTVPPWGTQRVRMLLSSPRDKETFPQQTLRLEARAFGKRLPLASATIGLDVIPDPQYLAEVFAQRKARDQVNARPDHAVEGRIYDAESGYGLHGVVLRLGDQLTVTSMDGSFLIMMPEEGTHHLFVDPLTLGIDRVPLRAVPVPITAGAEPKHNIQIPVSIGGKVEGEVQLFSSTRKWGATRRQVVAQGGVSNVLIELRNGDEHIRTFTDAKGRFQADKLRPGIWEVAVVEGEWPVRHSVEKPQVTVSVGPDRTKRVTFRILPDPRRITMRGSGVITGGGAP